MDESTYPLAEAIDKARMYDFVCANLGRIGTQHNPMTGELKIYAGRHLQFDPRVVDEAFRRFRMEVSTPNYRPKF